MGETDWMIGEEEERRRPEYSRLDDWEKKKKMEKANTKRKRIGETEWGLGGGKRRKKEKKRIDTKDGMKTGNEKELGKNEKMREVSNGMALI